jgi:integrase
MAGIFFLLEKRNGTASKTGEKPIRVSISIFGVRIMTTLGHSIKVDRWNDQTKEALKGICNSKGETGEEINELISKVKTCYFDLLNQCKFKKEKPTPEMIKDAIRKAIEKIPTEKSEIEPKIELGFFDIFDEFVSTESNKNDWAESTLKKFHTVKKHLVDFDKKLTFDFFNESGFTKYIGYLRSKKDLRNTSTLKQISFLKWFLKWAAKKGYNKELFFSGYVPNLAGNTERQIIFLDEDELKKVYNFEIPETKKYLERVRDVFCFCCFTGLRYSDVNNLKHADVKKDKIQIITVKTSDRLHIPLNIKAKAILDKYKQLKGEKALPVITNQKMNEYLKELMQLCEINAPETVVYWKGNESKSDTFPKYELIGTHAARRTFICIALSKGVPATNIMKITGHKDYQSMKPYVAVTEKSKKEVVEIFDEW